MDKKDDKLCVKCGKSATKMLSSTDYPEPNWFCMDHAKEWQNG